MDSSEHVAQNIYRLIFMMADIRMVEEPEISGDVWVFDAAHVSVAILLKHAGIMLKKALSLAQVSQMRALCEHAYSQSRVQIPVSAIFFFFSVRFRYYT